VLLWSLSTLETRCYLCDVRAASQQYLVALAKLREKKSFVLSEKTTRFVLSELSVYFRIEQICSQWKHFHEYLYWKILQKCVNKFLIRLQPDIDIRQCETKPTYIYDNILTRIIRESIKFSDRNWTNHKIKFFLESHEISIPLQTPRQIQASHRRSNIICVKNAICLPQMNVKNHIYTHNA